MSDPAPPAGTVRDWLDARAERMPDAPAYLFSDGAEPLSWGGLRHAAKAIASGLTARGTQKGESVAVMLPNGRAAILAFFGAIYGGCRATMINLAAGPEAMAYALDHSGARFVFIDADRIETFRAIAPAGADTLDAEKLADGDDETPLPPLDAVDHALLMYTSGTTGRPKGVLHSHESLLAGGWTPTLAHRLQPDDRGFCVLPIYHINGLCVTVVGALVSGGSLVLSPRFSASAFWADAARFQVTWASVVPTILSHLLHGEADPDPATRARLRFIRSASAPLAPEIQRGFEDRFSVSIIETMGLTETAAQILSNPLPPAPRKIGSPGIPFGCEATILGPDLTPLPRGETGEIAVRGPNVMLGYLRDDEATSAALAPGGWLRTGDLGRMDPEGYLFVTGRLKELIIKGGENIAPREIDEALYAHPDVVEAAAFGCPDPRYGEIVQAAVRLTPGSRVTPAELVALCVDRVGHFKAPDRVHLLAELPKGPSGKIQRLRLVEILAPADGV